MVGLLGPRQCGKTTLALQYTAQLKNFEATTNYFDLEDPLHLARLDNPRLALEELEFFTSSLRVLGVYRAGAYREELARKRQAMDTSA